MVNGRRNFRWDFIRSGYLVRLVRDGAADWFLLESPKRSHKGLQVSANITCEHVCSLLNKKGLYLTFDDTDWKSPPIGATYSLSMFLRQRFGREFGKETKRLRITWTPDAFAGRAAVRMKRRMVYGMPRIQA